MERRWHGSQQTTGLANLVDCSGRGRRIRRSPSLGHSSTGWGRNSGHWCGLPAAVVAVAAEEAVAEVVEAAAAAAAVAAALAGVVEEVG
jgi:hypothetical protein